MTWLQNLLVFLACFAIARTALYARDRIAWRGYERKAELYRSQAAAEHAHAYRVRMMEHECDIRDATGEPVEHENCQACNERRDRRDIARLKDRTRALSGPRVLPPWERGEVWFTLDEQGRRHYGVLPAQVPEVEVRRMDQAESEKWRADGRIG